MCEVINKRQVRIKKKLKKNHICNNNGENMVLQDVQVFVGVDILGFQKPDSKIPK